MQLNAFNLDFKHRYATRITSNKIKDFTQKLGRTNGLNLALIGLGCEEHPCMLMRKTHQISNSKSSEIHNNCVKISLPQLSLNLGSKSQGLDVGKEEQLGSLLGSIQLEKERKRGFGFQLPKLLFEFNQPLYISLLYRLGVSVVLSRCKSCIKS